MRAFLTVGPQGCGKSTWCDKVVQKSPGVQLISRDNILIELFGSTCLDPYTGGHLYALEAMWQKIEEVAQNGRVLLLDCWNGYGTERIKIVAKLHQIGYCEVIGLRFTTPLDICLRWYLAREARLRADQPYWNRESAARCCQDNYRLYHQQPVKLEQGFLAIREVNPCQLVLPDLSYL